jgi:hypothetical protein
MEDNMMAKDTGLDRFLSKITADVVRAAIENVSYMVIETDDEDSLLEQLTDESFKDSVIETSVVQFPDLTEIKSEEISNAYVHEKCSNLVEDTIVEVYDELRRIFDFNDQKMSNDIESSKKKLKLLDCIKDSDHLQAYFQELSLRIIQNAFDKIAVPETKHLEQEPYLAANKESDIEMNINIQGNEVNIEEKFGNNIDKYNTVHDFEINPEHKNSFKKENQSVIEDSNFQVDSIPQNEDFSIGSEQSKCGSTLASTANSTMYQTTGDESYNGQSTNQDSFFSARNETKGEHTTVDSTKFTTADEFKENSSVFLSFEKDLLQDSTVMQNTPGRIDRNSSDIDATLTCGPRQSTPLIDDKSNNYETTLPAAKASNILPEDSQHAGNDAGPCQSTPLKEDHKTTLPPSEESDILPKDFQHHVTEYERALQELSADESSLGDPSSPRTLSRQSSAFGNVTLEFDTDWEASMKGMQESKSEGTVKTAQYLCTVDFYLIYYSSRMKGMKEFFSYSQ